LPKMGLEEMREFDKVSRRLMSVCIPRGREQGHWHLWREVAEEHVALSS
jgi:hypothetical protein